jgi:nucleotide-binding universal stress UspA family protein
VAAGEFYYEQTWGGIMSVSLKNILVAKDLSRESSKVIRYAIELGMKFNAQVHILHVIPTVDRAVLNMVAISMGADKLAALNAENEANLTRETREHLSEALKDETDLLEEALTHPPKIEVLHGEPVPTILATADRLDADLIVLGSHSKGRLHYAFLGSVAEKILHKSHRAVFIVPP